MGTGGTGESRAGNMSHYLDIIIDWIRQLGNFAYLIMAIFAFGESLIIISYFLPCVVLMAAVGFLCYLKLFSFTGMIAATFLGHFAGEIANYYAGHHGGRQIFQKHNRVLSLDLLDKVERRFHENALRLMAIGQFIGMLRPLVGFTAGMIRYPFLRFTLAMFVLDFAWALGHLGIGFVLGASWTQAPQIREMGLIDRRGSGGDLFRRPVADRLGQVAPGDAAPAKPPTAPRPGPLAAPLAPRPAASPVTSPSGGSRERELIDKLIR